MQDSMKVIASLAMQATIVSEAETEPNKDLEQYCLTPLENIR